MFESITNFISQHLVITGTFAAMIGGAILKKTGALKWIRDNATKIGDKLGKLSYNVGVTITTKGNELPWIGPYYEYTIELVIIMVCEVIPGIIFKVCSNLTEGMKSDNKEFKK